MMRRCPNGDQRQQQHCARRQEHESELQEAPGLVTPEQAAITENRLRQVRAIDHLLAKCDKRFGQETAQQQQAEDDGSAQHQEPARPAGRIGECQPAQTPPSAQPADVPTLDGKLQALEAKTGQHRHRQCVGEYPAEGGVELPVTGQTVKKESVKGCAKSEEQGQHRQQGKSDHIKTSGGWPHPARLVAGLAHGTAAQPAQDIEDGSRLKTPG